MIVFSMAGKLKTLILLLALIALPLRGVAAVALCDCAQDQHAAIAMSMDQSWDQHGSHDHAGDHTHDGPSHDGANHGGDGDQQSSPAASACGACTACCVGGAVAPSAWISLSSAHIGASRIPFLERRVMGVVPAQLERPPLHLSA